MKGGELIYVPEATIAAAWEIQELATTQDNRITTGQLEEIRRKELEQLSTDLDEIDPIFSFLHDARMTVLEELQESTDSKVVIARSYINGLKEPLQTHIANLEAFDRNTDVFEQRLRYLELLKVVEVLE